jgi:23S rRNA (guanosine2251-2'-O)-methyltransferase
MAHNLFGKKVLMDNINSKDIINVDLSKQNRYLISELNKHHIPYKIRDDTFFNTFPKQLNHQGIVITIDKKQTITTIESLVEFTNLKTRSVILVIDSIQDPQNFGSILRTCDAMKVDAIIYKKNNQVQINDFVSKTSMGAIQHLNLIKVSNLNQVITTLKKTGF